MKIFDGVPVNPATLSPTWQGVLGVAMLLGNSFIEADKIRDQRVAREQAQRQEPTTLSDVMEQSGLKIPYLHDALTKFMGGTDEARAAATLIVNTPDPVKLLRDFARQYAPASAANGPIVTPSPAAAPPRPVPASPPPPANSSKAAAHPSSPRSKPAAFRPEFTREGLEAADRATAAGPRPKPATFRPEFTREGLEAAARGGASTSPTSPPAAARSLLDTLAERLAVLTEQMDAHQRELDTRIRCAEAELAALCEELQDLRVFNDRPVLFVVPTLDEAEAAVASPSAEDGAPLTLDGEGEAAEQAEPAPASEAPTLAETDTAPPEAATAPPEPATAPPEPATDAAPLEEPTAEGEGDATDADDVTPPVEYTAAVAGSPPVPSAPTQADLARAFSMLGKFTDQAVAHYASEAERVRALERKISHMRGLVERSRGSAARRG
jgi:hypothetical protein